MSRDLNIDGVDHTVVGVDVVGDDVRLKLCTGDGRARYETITRDGDITFGGFFKASEADMETRRRRQARPVRIYTDEEIERAASVLATPIEEPADGPIGLDGIAARLDRMREYTEAWEARLQGLERGLLD